MAKLRAVESVQPVLGKTHASPWKSASESKLRASGSMHPSLAKMHEPSSCLPPPRSCSPTSWCSPRWRRRTPTTQWHWRRSSAPSGPCSHTWGIRSRRPPVPPWPRRGSWWHWNSCTRGCRSCTGSRHAETRSGHSWSPCRRAARGEPPSMSLISSGEHGRRRRIVQPAPRWRRCRRQMWRSRDSCRTTNWCIREGAEPSFCVYAAL